jgi:hypothetical protein
VSSNTTRQLFPNVRELHLANCISGFLDTRTPLKVLTLGVRDLVSDCMP